MLQKQITTRSFFSWIAVALLFSFVVVSVAFARVNNNDQVVSVSQQQDNVTSVLLVAATTTPTSAVLVDLSDTTNFKHNRSTGVLEVSRISIDWNADLNATTTLKFGLIASTSASGALADVYWFDTVSFSSTQANNIYLGRQSKTLDYQPSAMKLSISSALPTGFITSDKSINDPTFATTTPLASPLGAGTSGSKPAVGDLVMRIYDQKGTATTTVITTYRSVEQ